MHSNTNKKVDVSKKPVPPPPSSSTEKLIEGLPADVYNYLASVLSHEMVLYEAARQHLQHNVEQCGQL